MSTIATPRDPSTPMPRRMNSSQAIITPTSSSRPSLDTPRSAGGSPNPNATGQLQPGSAASTGKRNNRAALREYYNIKKAASVSTTPLLEVTDPLGDTTHESSYSEVAPSELDAETFDADAFVARKLQESSMEELLRTYTRVLGEIRALDAEKKALVYDNYSKLITATETIRKMRANMDPLNPMASTLDPAIAHIYSQASSIREALRQSVPKPENSKYDETARRRKTRKLVVEVLGTPERIRQLVRDGKLKEARSEWAMPKRLLETWKEKGVGGEDVDVCLADGEAALRGEDTP